jgi:hypothetical protein
MEYFLTGLLFWFDVIGDKFGYLVLVPSDNLVIQAYGLGEDAGGDQAGQGPSGDGQHLGDFLGLE